MVGLPETQDFFRPVQTLGYRNGSCCAGGRAAVPGGGGDLPAEEAGARAGGLHAQERTREVTPTAKPNYLHSLTTLPNTFTLILLLITF